MAETLERVAATPSTPLSFLFSFAAARPLVDRAGHSFPLQIAFFALIGTLACSRFGVFTAC